MSIVRPEAQRFIIDDHSVVSPLRFVDWKQRRALQDRGSSTMPREHRTPNAGQDPEARAFSISDLRSRIEESGVNISPSKFRQIVAAAGLPPSERGRAGANRRFSASEIRRLCDAARNGSCYNQRKQRFRHGDLIASCWETLIEQSASHA
tara:strand:- start:1064 stop:1513 length:450 start_codon:yes stop_codon:yes gene_type:complete